MDAAAQHLAVHHAGRLQCRRGCASCCGDGISVFELEAERIRRAHGDLLERDTPHPAGACAFLDGEGACRIYPSRPYVCRTQGLPLRWLDWAEDGQAVELRDICPLNEAGPPLETLDPAVCWPIGPVEAELVALQAELHGGQLRRIALRDLWPGRDRR